MFFKALVGSQFNMYTAVPFASPQNFFAFFSIQQTSSHLQDAPILSFTHPILLRGVVDCQLVMNTSILIKIINPLVCIFRFIIRPNNLDSHPTLISNQMTQEINQAHHLRSSVKIRKYLLPFKEQIFIVPHFFMCTNCCLFEALQVLPFQKGQPTLPACFRDSMYPKLSPLQACFGVNLYKTNF